MTGGRQDNNMKHLVKTVRGLVGAGYPQPSRRPRHEASTRDPVSGGGSSLCCSWRPVAPSPACARPCRPRRPRPRPARRRRAGPGSRPGPGPAGAKPGGPGAAAGEPPGGTGRPPGGPGGRQGARRPGPLHLQLPQARPSLRFPAPRRTNIIPRACASTTPRNTARPGTSCTST